MFNLWYRTKNL